MEVNDQSQQGASDWLRSQGQCDNLAYGWIFTNESIDNVGNLRGERTYDTQLYN